MNYLTLAEIKKHLNIDTSFTDDDTYIQGLGDVVEEMVAKHIMRSLEDICSENDGKLPAPIKHAMLMLLGHFYNVRESVQFVSTSIVPLSYEYLLQLYKSYDYTK